jgi:hypothetical protein
MAANATSFPKGKSANPGGRPKVQLSEESEGLLEAMRHVLRKNSKTDLTYEKAECRKWLRTDRRGFMTKLADLEREEMRKPPEEKDGEEIDVDMERLIGLVDQQLEGKAWEKADEVESGEVASEDPEGDEG